MTPEELASKANRDCSHYLLRSLCRGCCEEAIRAAQAEQRRRVIEAYEEGLLRECPPDISLLVKRVADAILAQEEEPHTTHKGGKP